MTEPATAPGGRRLRPRPLRAAPGQRPADDGGPTSLLPRWLRATVAYALAALVLGTLAYVVAWLLLQVGLVSGALLVALLLTALLSPVVDRLAGRGVPRSLAALLAVVVLLGVPAAVGLLVLRRVQEQFNDLGAAVTLGLDDVRTWLVEGPLSLDEQQVTRLRDAVVSYVEGAAPSPSAGASAGLALLAALVLAVVSVFFLLKDGPQMWAWARRLAPPAQRERVAAAGEGAWTTLRRYVAGTAVIALADAIGIGLALVLIGVPLWASLALLTFVGAFVPLLGATVAGGAAVLVALVSEGGRAAVLVLLALLVVQQIEGNLLQPLVMGRAVQLHPLVVLLSVSCGALLLGVIGALIAVPLTAVAYRVARTLRAEAPPTPS